MRVFDVIATAKPARLLVVADGPCNDAEAGLCEETRRVVMDHISWPCEVLTNFSPTNMGCKKRVSSGLDWVFTQVEEAIIIEDDCLPDLSFFRFCTEMLERYRHDIRIGHIGGNYFGDGKDLGSESYYLSRYVTIWGWATWRRAWRNYDVNLSLWPELKLNKNHYKYFPSSEEVDYFEAHWDDLFEGKIDTWDGQWLFAIRTQGLLSICPRVNLVSNIGFRVDGSHAVDSDVPYANMPCGHMNFPLIHPEIKSPDERMDTRFAALMVPLKRPLWQRTLWKLKNPHWYGAVMRRIPFFGDIWGRLRSRQKSGTL